jgi:hypothetical protein
LATSIFAVPPAFFAVDLYQFVVRKPDDDFVLRGDDLEQRYFIGGKSGLDHNALHDEAGNAETEQQTFGYMHSTSLVLRAGMAGHQEAKKNPARQALGRTGRRTRSNGK